MSEDTPPVDPSIAAAQAATAEAFEVRRQTSTLSIIVLADMAIRLSSKFDVFATWLLAGFGAAVALMLTSHDAITLLSPYAIRSDAMLFCAAVIVTVIEKYIAIIVIAGSEAAIATRTIILDHIKQRIEANQSPQLDVRLFANEIIRPIFRPFRSFAERSLRKANAGDYGAGMRRLVRLSQVQGLLLFVQILLFLAALGMTIVALPGMPG